MSHGADGSLDANDIFSSDTSGGADVLFGGPGRRPDRRRGGREDTIFGNQATFSLGTSADFRRNPLNQLEEIESLFSGQGGADPIDGGPVGDIILGGAGDDTILGDTDGTTSDPAGGRSSPVPGPGPNPPVGGEFGADVILGDNGDFFVTGFVVTTVATTDPTLGGNDMISGGYGPDTILGGPGADLISGDSGDDVILGDSGRLEPRPQGATVSITTTDPTLGNHDTITGGDGNDIIAGGADDSLSGGANSDILVGDSAQSPPDQRPGHEHRHDRPGLWQRRHDHR